MKFKFVAVIASVMLATLSLSSCDLGLKHNSYADKQTPAAYFYFTLNAEGTAYSVAANKDETLPEKIYLPLTYDNKPVTEISVSGFEGNTQLKELTIPDGYSSIGVSAFRNCVNLTKVKMSGVKTVGSLAFKDCSSLRTVEFSDTLLSVGVRAFAGTAILEAKFSSVESIDEEAFANCGALGYVFIPANATAVSETAFSGCDNARIDVSPNNVTYASENGKLTTK